MTVAAKIDLSSWQEHFDFLLPRRELLRPDEVARALDCDERTVARLLEKGDLAGHEYNAGTDKRMCRRYRRDAVILYLARTATYSPDEFTRGLLEIIRKLPRRDVAMIHAATGEHLRKQA